MAQPRSHLMDVYGVWIHVATDRAQWRKIKKHTNLPMGKVRSAGLTERFTDAKTGLVQLCVYLDVATQTPHELLELCAHEATHASGMILDHIGTAYDGESESLAYLVGWMTAWLWSGCQ